jgi:hypothetical protein
MFSPAVNIYFKIIKISHIELRMFCLQTLFFNKVSVRFYSLAPMRNKCVCTLSVPFLDLLLFCLWFKMMDQVSSAATVWDKKASPLSHTPWNIRDHGRCMRWVPRSLIIEHNTDKKAISSELLACFEADEEAILSQIFTADKTWVHNFELETERSRTRNGTNRAYTHLFLVATRL